MSHSASILTLPASSTSRLQPIVACNASQRKEPPTHRMGFVVPLRSAMAQVRFVTVEHACCALHHVRRRDTRVPHPLCARCVFLHVKLQQIHLNVLFITLYATGGIVYAGYRRMQVAECCETVSNQLQYYLECFATLSNFYRIHKSSMNYTAVGSIRCSC